MATKTVTFRGKCEWAKPWPKMIDREYEDPDNGRGGNWSVNVFLDDASVKLWNAIGPRAKLKDGNRATFRRYEYANFGKGPEALGSPVVTGVEEGTAIGNGSDVSVTVDVYDTKFKGKPLVALRWVAIHVENLVVYEKPSDTPFDTTPPVH